MEEEKEKKKKRKKIKRASTWMGVTLTQGKRKGKKFSNTKPYKFFTNFSILVSSFYLVLPI